MTWLAYAAFAAGTVAKAGATIRQGNILASAERANAEIAQLYATQVRQSGAYEESKIRREKARTLARQRALYAKSGVLIGEGTPIDVMADSAAEFEMDIRALQYNTEVEARKFEFESAYRKQLASLHKSSAKTAAIGGVLLDVGTLALTSGFGKTPAKTPKTPKGEGVLG